MPCHPTPLRFSRLLLTGAAGGLGRELRRRLKAYCDTLRLSDMADLGVQAPGEELCPARLEDASAVHDLLAGVDAVLAGALVEPPLRKSVAYQPEPLSWKPAAVTCLANDSAPQDGQVVRAGSDIFCSTSLAWPHALHR